MLQCMTIVAARGGAAWAPGAGAPPPRPAVGVTMYVCAASTSMFSGKVATLSRKVRVASRLPRRAEPGPNSGMFVVNSRVTSITGALSGP
jgi:hypothetical protein